MVSQRIVFSASGRFIAVLFWRYGAWKDTDYKSTYMHHESLEKGLMPRDRTKAWEFVQSFQSPELGKFMPVCFLVSAVLIQIDRSMINEL